MSSPAKRPRPEPTREPGVISYLISPNAQEHIEWMKTVFECKVGSMHWADPSGARAMLPDAEAKPKEGWQVMHAEVQINDGKVYLSDHIKSSGYPEIGVKPEEVVGTEKGRGIMLYVDLGDEIDAVWERAMEGKATVQLKLEKQFWGARHGVFVDPYGFEWAVSKWEGDDENESKKPKSNSEEEDGANGETNTA